MSSTDTRQRPSSSAIEPNDVAVVMHREARLIRQMLDEQMGECAVVDIRAGDYAGRGDRLGLVAALDDERRPFGDLGVVLAIFHAAVAMMRRHLLVACAQEGDIGVAPDEAHMRARVEEGARIRDSALLDEIGPELAREVELGVDLQRLGDVDAAVLAQRRIIELAIGGMAGSGVVPTVRALLCAIVQGLEQGDGQRGFELFEKVPRVALMMPAPIRTMSGFFSKGRCSCFRLLVRGLEAQFGALLVDDIGAPPRLIADQPPLVAGAAIVLRKQDVARTDREGRARLRLELEGAGQGDDEAWGRVLMPLVRNLPSASPGRRSRQPAPALPTESPRIPSARSIEPSSNSELPSSPVHKRTQRIIANLHGRWRALGFER